MNLLAVDVLSALQPLVDTLANTVPPPDPAVSPAPSPTSVLVEIKTGEKSWIEPILASPLLAACGAIGAAWLVFRGTSKQVEKLHDGNTETARKNKEDQWWSTLKWAYEQASSDSNKTSDVFKERAVLGIFESLATPGISNEQVAALENIKSVFKERADPSTEASVENLERAIDASKSGTSPIGPRLTQKGSTYRRHVMRSAGIVSRRLGLTQVFAHRQGAPLLFETAAGKLIGLQPLFMTNDEVQENNPRLIVKEMCSQAMSREFTVKTERSGGVQEVPGRKLDAFAVVTNVQRHWPWLDKTGVDAPYIYFPEPPETNAEENQARIAREREQQANGGSPGFMEQRNQLLEDGLAELIGRLKDDGRAESDTK